MGTDPKQAATAKRVNSQFHAVSLPPFREGEREKICTWTERAEEFQGSTLRSARGQFRLQWLLGALEPLVPVCVPESSVIVDSCGRAGPGPQHRPACCGSHARS